jgi:hypothetical protein
MPTIHSFIQSRKNFPLLAKWQALSRHLGSNDKYPTESICLGIYRPGANSKMTIFYIKLEIFTLLIQPIKSYPNHNRTTQELREGGKPAHASIHR